MDVTTGERSDLRVSSLSLLRVDLDYVKKAPSDTNFKPTLIQEAFQVKTKARASIYLFIYLNKNGLSPITS